MPPILQQNPSSRHEAEFPSGTRCSPARSPPWGSTPPALAGMLQSATTLKLVAPGVGALLLAAYAALAVGAGALAMEKRDLG